MRHDDSYRRNSERTRPRLGFAAIIFASIAGLAVQACSQTPADTSAASTQTVTAKSEQDLLKAVQNPVADLISVPIQNNTNFGVNPYGRVQNVISLQPVIPVNVSDNWMLITRVALDQKE